MFGLSFNTRESRRARAGGYLGKRGDMKIHIWLQNTSYRGKKLAVFWWHYSSDLQIQICTFIIYVLNSRRGKWEFKDAVLKNRTVDYNVKCSIVCFIMRVIGFLWGLISVECVDSES